MAVDNKGDLYILSFNSHGAWRVTGARIGNWSTR